MRRTLATLTPHLPISYVKSSTLKNTIRLPRTTFPIVTDFDPKNPLYIELLRKCTEDLYDWQRQNLPSKDTFVLHDGPPYANGDLHMGHALNKILKDMVNRTMLMDGRRVDYRPGWDCHGLPIELRALQELREKTIKEGLKDNQIDKRLTKEGVREATEAAMRMGKIMSPVEVRSVAKDLAERTVVRQMEGFKWWGVMADWEGRWKTMDKEYEVRQLQIFLAMLKKGLIYRKFKPVYWSPSSGTALAEAELEYNHAHTSTAAFVKFPITKLGAGLCRYTSLDDSIPLSAAIWTTTPWTIPANRAIAISPLMEYAILKTAQHGRLLVARDRIEVLRSALNDPDDTVEADCIIGENLLGTLYRNPLLPEDNAPAQPILPASFVTSGTGTGLVHCAPGHGMEDYLLGQQHAVPPFSPVDSAGKFTDEALPHNPLVLTGKAVQYSGNKAVIGLLRKSGSLLSIQEEYVHKYPYDWRTKQPVIIRSTEQWFADVFSIKSAAKSSLEDVKFIPEAGKTRLKKTVESRSEWCISRQRAWGVPIPAMYHEQTGQPLLTEESVKHIIYLIQQHSDGVDIWWDKSLPEELFVPPSMLGEGKTKWVRGTETMDVWFDSGSSWAILQDEPHTDPATSSEGRPLADLYLEGSDQHRGWFQSSLLTKIASSTSIPTPKNPHPKPTAPFGMILTHGFVLDEKGRKMSKSLGNVVSPQDVITGKYPPMPPGSKKNIYGAGKGGPGMDALRLWAASCDYTTDVAIGGKVLVTVGEMLRKLRVTARFLVGNLDGWDGVEVPYEELTTIDQYALYQVHHANTTTLDFYRSLSFNKAVSILSRYTTNSLSSFYLNIIKDRMYSDAANSASRRAAQTVLWHILCNYVSLLHPIVPLLTAEIWHHIPTALKEKLGSTSMAEVGWYQPRVEWNNVQLAADFEVLEEVGRCVNAAVELAREARKIKVALETDVVLHVLPESKVVQILDKYRLEMKQMYIVSGLDVAVLDSGEAKSVLKGDDDNVCQGEINPEHSLRKLPTPWRITAPPCKLTNGEKISVVVKEARGKKCVRCWVYHAEEEGGMCARCEEVVMGMIEVGEVKVDEVD